MNRKCVKSLKPGKADVTTILSSDAFIQGTHALYKSVAQLFTCMLKSGTAPVDMSTSLLVPIPKRSEKIY